MRKFFLGKRSQKLQSTSLTVTPQAAGLHSHAMKNDWHPPKGKGRCPRRLASRQSPAERHMWEQDKLHLISLRWIQEGFRATTSGYHLPLCIQVKILSGSKEPKTTKFKARSQRRQRKSTENKPVNKHFCFSDLSVTSHLPNLCCVFSSNFSFSKQTSSSIALYRVCWKPLFLVIPLTSRAGDEGSKFEQHGKEFSRILSVNLGSLEISRELKVV